MFNKEKHNTRMRKYMKKWRKQNSDKVKASRKKYNLSHKEKKNEIQRAYFKTAKGVLCTIKGRIRRTKNKKDYLKVSKEEFIKWYDSQERKCFYCSIPESLISDKWCKQSKRLQVDRVDNNRFYELGNMVLACPVCNSFKADIFSVKETKEIAQKYLKPRWKKLLG